MWGGGGGGGVRLRWWTLCLMDCGSSSLQLRGIGSLTCSSWSCPEDSALPSWPGEPPSQREEWAGRRPGWEGEHPNISGSEAIKRKTHQLCTTDARRNSRHWLVDVNKFESHLFHLSFQLWDTTKFSVDRSETFLSASLNKRLSKKRKNYSDCLQDFPWISLNKPGTVCWVTWAQSHF